MRKGGHFDIFEYSRIIFYFSWKTWTCASKRGCMVSLPNSVTHMWPVCKSE